MASTNFLPFDPNKENVMGDTEYNSSQQRLNGVQGGIASSKLHNKSMIQTSLVAAAIAQYMVSAGYDALDTDTVAGFADKLKHAILANQTGLAKATTEMVETGTDDTAYITSYLLKHFYDYWRATREQGALQSDNTHYVTPQVMHANKQWRELERLTVSGTYTVPDGIYQLGVFCMGGGMGGGTCQNMYNRNNCVASASSGFIRVGIMKVTPGQKIPYVIGAGGPGAEAEEGDGRSPTPTGGDTTFGEIIAWGGKADISISELDDQGISLLIPSSTGRIESCGFCCGIQGTWNAYNRFAHKAASGFNPNLYTINNKNPNMLLLPTDWRMNPFDPLLTFGAAGGHASISEGGEVSLQPASVETSLGRSGAAKSPNGENATGYGNGGGAGIARSSHDSGTGGNGSNGIIILYT